MTTEEREQRKRKALELWKIGLSSPAIAERLQLRTQTVIRWVSEAGLRKPGEGPRRRYDCCGASGIGGRVSPRIDGGC
jgi:transposase